MNFWSLINDLASEIYGAKISASECVCHGHLEQLDGFLAPGVPVRILASERYHAYHLSIGKIPDNPPPPISQEELIYTLENYRG